MKNFKTTCTKWRLTDLWSCGYLRGTGDVSTEPENNRSYKTEISFQSSQTVKPVHWTEKLVFQEQTPLLRFQPPAAGTTRNPLHWLNFLLVDRRFSGGHWTHHVWSGWGKNTSERRADCVLSTIIVRSLCFSRSSTSGSVIVVSHTSTSSSDHRRCRAAPGRTSRQSSPQLLGLEMIYSGKPKEEFLQENIKISCEVDKHPRKRSEQVSRDQSEPWDLLIPVMNHRNPTGHL